MSEYMFGTGLGHLSDAVAEAARKAGGCLINYTEPRGERRHWFTVEDAGFPFNRACAEEVLDAVREAATAEDRKACPELFNG